MGKQTTDDDAAATFEILVDAGALGYMLQQDGYGLYVTDRVVDPDPRHADKPIYWYWSPRALHADSHLVYQVDEAWEVLERGGETMRALYARPRDDELRVRLPYARAPEETRRFMQWP